ncbi:hypothetical protein GIS00_07400 [Nakamurella sp. YIM 132087]|uniref:DUF2029 domain-containing protein n=1 Tax=Nakamurella alba TaxID=2665158 RepID=A0A7K1FI44_9ACTN|nr:polyprenol phosphomannose-dependent alpha 1,6 mannosyltransferase MptB [Nakamurella alba]MTD13768.1 hypothetical protein [Nakamurella alba]
MSSTGAAKGTAPGPIVPADTPAAADTFHADDPPARPAAEPGHHVPASAPLDVADRRRLGRLRRWGTVGALLMAVGSTSSYGAATPIPNPLDGLRVIGLLSRLGPAALACSYAGIGLLVLCWFLIGRLSRPGRERRLSRTQLTHTLAMWSVPLLITPPIFSRDSYSYLAVGQMMANGLDPYAQGPYDALGDGDPLAHQVDARWQHTTSPYGPAFLLIARGVVAITGDSVVAGVLVQRLVELLGVAMIVWALPRLARRCGIDPVAALWLGALNPVLLFHLVAGAHNEALMLGFMLAGLVVALGRTADGPQDPPWLHERPWLRVVAGSALITVGVGVKATAAMALAFLVVALARRAGGRWADLWRWALVVGATTLAVFAVLTLWAGVGLGWISALNTPGSVRSFLSVSTTLGAGAGQIGLLLGLGDHSSAAIDVMQPVGTALGALLALVVLWRCWRPGRSGRILEPIQGLGLALGAFVLLGPVIQPWYLLWAALPLAASTGLSGYRRATIWLTTVFAVIIMPNGATIPVFTIFQAVAVGAVVVGGVLLLLRRGDGLPAGAPASPLARFRRPPRRSVAGEAAASPYSDAS